MVLRALAFFCAAALCGQAQQGATGAPAPQPPASQPPAGLETDWEMAPVLEEMAAHAGRLLPELDRVDARSWVNKGASETYLEQLESSKQQARALADGAKALAGDPEKLSAGLVVLFRIQALEAMLGSLVEGLRRYQGAEEADRLASLSAENGANRDRFQHYLVDLAADQEQRVQVMDKEAQRCRGLLAAPAPPRAGKKK
jgi:hypothetical protein